MSEGGLTCVVCGRKTLHRGPAINHVLHAILTLFLCGLWAPVWIILAINAGRLPWTCTTCGTKRAYALE